MNSFQRILILILLLATVPALAAGAKHPRLLISADDVELMTEQGPESSLFSAEVDRTRKRLDRWLDAIPDVPVPRDAGGGYTHEQHKRNASLIRDAGLLFQLGRDPAHAALARDLLIEYAAMYPELTEHPQKKEQSPGRLFWQSLNEAVWLVYAIQGYDAIIETLDERVRETIESGLLHPMVSFLSEQSPQTFDRIHNHGTWAVAAVGMTGYVLGNREYVERALFGLKKDGNAGFIKQLDELFSPDGYYSEGPYYQRYALMPFLFFATSINRNEPSREIFQYRNSILLKAIQTTIQLSYAGYFFPLNDALKDKGLDTIELCYGVAIAYGITQDPSLLSIAIQQDRIVLTGDGFRVAKAIEAGKAEPFEFRSLQLKDGPNGDQGVLAILRSGSEPGDQAVVMKSTSQGMGHGHFDKLAWLFYDNRNEIVSDYGSARFLNVEEKNGGHYLPENKTWAKQTVAHNTLVVDETSHFGGKLSIGAQQHPEPLFFGIGEKTQLAAARMESAYDGVVFSRAIILLSHEMFAKPVVLDVLRVQSSGNHQYDLPLHYKGHITNVSHPVQASTQSMAALGAANGYQHLWMRAKTRFGPDEMFSMTWLTGDRFYTWSVLADGALEVLFTETGANDPNFNLRREPGVILRARNRSDHLFVSLLEPHGEYNGSREFTTASASNVRGIKRVSQGGKDIVRITNRSGDYVMVALSWNPDPDSRHSLKVSDSDIEWAGFSQVFEGREVTE